MNGLNQWRLSILSMVAFCFCLAATITVLVLPLEGKSGGLYSQTSKISDGFFSHIEGVVQGQSRQQVLHMLGTPDASRPQIMDVIQILRSGNGRGVLYYSNPSCGGSYFLEAIELSNDKVTWTYKTWKNPLCLLLLAAPLIAVLRRLKWEKTSLCHTVSGKG